MASKGKNLEHRFQAWMKALDIYCCRFFDARSMGGICVERPADFFIWLNKRLIFVECKECAHNSISITNFRPSQLKAAMELVKKDIEYKAVINLNGVIYLIDAKFIIFAISQNLKSLSLEYLNEYGHILENKEAFLKYI